MISHDLVLLPLLWQTAAPWRPLALAPVRRRHHCRAAAAVRHSFFSFIEVIMVNECETMNREEKVNDEKESYYLAHMNERQPHHKTLI